MTDQLAIRVKLVFHPPGILPSELRKQGLSKCWFQLPINEPSISDFEAHLISSFHLHHSCPDGILLQVGGFSLPPSQPLSLVREDDTIRIFKRSIKEGPFEELTGGEVPRYLEPSDNARSRALENGWPAGEDSPLAVPLPPPIEEEEEDSELDADGIKEKADGMGGLLEWRRESDLLRRSHSEGQGQETENRKPAERRSLALRREENANMNDAVRDEGKLDHRALEVAKGEQVQGKKRKFVKQDVSGSAVRGKKKAQKIVHASTLENPQDGDGLCQKKQGTGKKMTPKEPKKIKTQRTPEESHVQKQKNRTRLTASFGKENNSGDAGDGEHVEIDWPMSGECSNGREELKETAAVLVSKRDLKEGIEGESGMPLEVESSEEDVAMVKESSAPKRKENMLTPEGSNRISKDTAEKLQKEGPSRSARRKKAKKLWLKTQEMAVEVEDNQEVPKKEKPSPSSETTAIHAMAKGHIRFGEGDEEPVVVTAVTPVLNLGSIASKRHGQSWGQQKDRNGFQRRQEADGGSYNQRWPMADRRQEQEEMDSTKQVEVEQDYDSLPALSGPPKENEVLAYRLVELTPSWEPELSSFREGRVVTYDSSSGYVTIIPTGGLGAPLSSKDGVKIASHIDREMDEEVGASAYPTPYQEDGTLEIELSSLVDARVVSAVDYVPENCAQEAVDLLLEGEKAFPEVERVGEGETEGVAPLDGDSQSPVQSEQDPDRRLSLDVSGLPCPPNFSLLARPTQTPPNTPLGIQLAVKEGGIMDELTMDASVKTPSLAESGAKADVGNNELDNGVHHISKGRETASETTPNGDTLEKVKKVGAGNEANGEKVASPWQLWADLSRDLERKRAELAAGKAGILSMNGSPADSGKGVSDNHNSPSNVKSVASGSGRKTRTGPMGSSSRAIRAAAMGPTLALLRAEGFQTGEER